jgi:hypothetical protein
MSNFTFVAISDEAARQVRAMRRSDDGLLARRQIVEPDGGAPCRHCLKEAAPGEPVILASFSPFSGFGPYNERGPIFVHEANCRRFADSDGVPEVIGRRLVVIRSYNAAEEIIEADLIDGRDAPQLIERLLANAEAAFLHVRTARYGCYLARVERAA